MKNQSGIKWMKIGCFFLLIFLFFFSENLLAKTFVFKPASASANYSDTANWVNLEYPGRQIEYGDTIAFEKNNAFNQVIIDSAVIVFGYCTIGDNITCTIPVGIVFTVQREWPPQGFIEEKIYSSLSSLLEVNGTLNVNLAEGRFYGRTIISGLMVNDGEYNGAYGYWQTVNFSELNVFGSITGTAARVYADSLFVAPAASVRISSGYSFNNGLLNVDSMHNQGEVVLSNETQLFAAYINNEGSIKAGALTGKILNSGAIEVEQRAPNTETANIHDVVNNGTIQLAGSTFAPVRIHSIINNGIFAVGDILGGEIGASPWLQVDGQVSNTKTWFQAGSDNGANLSGDWINDGTCVLNGNGSFESGIFTNNHIIQIINGNTGFSIQLHNQFLNYGIMSVAGKLEVFGALYNYGVFSQEQ